MRAVIYFCKSPQAGQVKTRLARSIGETDALAVYTVLLDSLLGLSLHVTRFVAYSGDAHFIPPPLSRFAQQGETLGERMCNAFLHLFDQGFDQVVLVGADIPRVDADVLEGALASLDSHDAVLSPTKDGGYYLIGFTKAGFTCNAFDAAIFDNANVYALTCKALAPLHVSHGAMLEDIDTLHDLRRFCAQFPAHSLSQFAKPILAKLPHVSLIMPVYYEDKSAVRTIAHAFESAANKDFEVIVVDTHARTCIDALPFSTPVRLHTAPKGRANQLNAGFALARGEVVLFLHADTLLPKDWDRFITEALHVNDAGAFRLHIDSSSKWLRLIALATNIRANLLGSPYGDQGQFFNAHIFETLGGYPTLPIMEDVAIMKALKHRGFTLKILKENVTTSPRRWHKEGLVYTTLRNRLLSTLYALGVSPERLARWYRALKYGEK